MAVPVMQAIRRHQEKAPNVARFIDTGLTWVIIVTASGYALILR